MGAIMTLGKGSIQSISTKQKVNTCSSTKVELFSVDDIISKVMWTTQFLEEQGYGVCDKVIYHNNMSSIKLENNGKASSRKHTRHMDIKFFYIIDMIKRGLVQTEYCPTDKMVSNYMTKPLIGRKFWVFQSKIMNIPLEAMPAHNAE